MIGSTAVVVVVAVVVLMDAVLSLKFALGKILSCQVGGNCGCGYNLMNIP